MQNQPNYFSVIPASVRDDDRLPASAKLLYGDIASLTKSEGYCWASNEWFARKMNLSIRAISKLVTCLQRAGHIRVEVFKGNVRHIWLTIAEIRPATRTHKSSTAHVKKFHRPRTNVLHINKESNKGSTHSASPRSEGSRKSGHHPQREAFIALWSAAYEDFYGVSYKVQDGKDGKAADGLLVLKGMSSEQLIEIARKAWNRKDGFNCKHAVSLSGFASRFNEIRGELGLLRKSSGTRGF